MNMTCRQIDSSNDETQYPFGFLLGRELSYIPERFQKRKLNEFDFCCDPSLPLDFHEAGDDFVACLGTLVYLGQPADEKLSKFLHQKLRNSMEAFQEVADQLVGRFVLIYSKDGSAYIQNDAIGVRSVFWGKSPSGVILGSHCQLVGMQKGIKRSYEPIPYKWGFPGLTTPNPNVFYLPASCEMNVGTGAIRRFFPAGQLSSHSIEDCWDYAFSVASATLSRLLLRDKPVLVSLTSGLDTRTTLAAIRNEISKVRFFTYDTDTEASRIDISVAKKIASQLKLDHLVVSAEKPPDHIRDRLRGCTIGIHIQSVASAYYANFGFNRFIHVRSNLLELFRAYIFKKNHKKFRKGLSDPKVWADFYLMNLRAGISPQVAPYYSAFQQLWSLTDLESAVSRANSWDLYFIEHRMRAWHSIIAAESDIAFDTAILFNSRDIIRRFCGVPPRERANSDYLQKLFNSVLPELKGIPINPTSVI